MAARADPPPTVEDDPSTASDAVSLHTIAEQADAYAAQEQEDADFALALALEEQESARYARTQRILDPQDSEPTVPRITSGTEEFPPYRDEPEAEDGDDPPPYRDDPDAEPAEGDQDTDAEAAAALPQRQNVVLRIVRKIVKAWLCYLICSTVLTIIIVIVVLALAFFHGGKQGNNGNPKKAAWLASGSEDWDLNVHKLYPALHESTDPLCKKDWEDIVAGLPCHRMILSTAWDDGNATQAKAEGADPVYYKEAVCTQECKNELQKLAKSIHESCHERSNRFDFENYGKDGKAYFDADTTEEGPYDVSKNLLARYGRLCSGPPKRYIGQQPPSCAEYMWMTWGIVDGMNEGNLNGLDTFLEQTSIRKTIPAFKQTVVKLMRSGENRTFTRSVKSRDVGPGRRETDCTDCERDWFLRKMLSFRYGGILEPGTRTPMKLADFADKMKNASQRCYAYNQQEDYIWEAAGLWCNGGPCPLDNDTLPWQVINVLHGYDKTEPPPTPNLDRVPAHKKQAVDTLLTSVRNMRCPALGITQHIIQNPFMTSASFLSHLCTPICLNSIDKIESLLTAASYPSSPFDLLSRSISNARSLCKSTPAISFTSTPDTICAPGYAALGLTPLISTPSISAPPISRLTILSTFTTALQTAKEWNDGFRPGTLTKYPELQKIRIAESACNTCAGAMFIGEEGRWNETVKAFLEDPEVDSGEYVRVAREGWDVCSRMFGVRLRGRLRREWLEKVGLGEGVGGVPLG